MTTSTTYQKQFGTTWRRWDKGPNHVYHTILTLEGTYLVLCNILVPIGNVGHLPIKYEPIPITSDTFPPFEKDSLDVLATDTPVIESECDNRNAAVSAIIERYRTEVLRAANINPENCNSINKAIKNREVTELFVSLRDSILRTIDSHV